MVLYALASYVADLLKQVAEEEIRMLLGVTDEIDKMGDKLLDLKNFLPDADRRNIMAVEEWETLPPLDEEWLKAMTALIPNGEQFFADRGFSLDKYRQPDNMHLMVKAQTDMIAELREQQQVKGYVEIEVTDDEEEEGARAHAGRGRRRFRPGVCKKPGGEIKKLN